MQGAAKPLPDVDTMIARLADRLRASPNDAEGWRMLGWSYFETRRFPDAVTAYARAVALQPNSAALQSAYGEALSAADKGRVPPEALQAFRAAQKIDAKDERARYYLALADKQAGKSHAALEAWIAALKEAPAGSLWAARLRAQIADTARALNVDVTARLPSPAVLPEKSFAAAGSAQQVAALSPGEQQAMIANMVEGLDQRLARAPNDPEGWVRLIRSRKVLGQMDLARASLNRALLAFKNDAQTRARVQAAAANIGVTAN
jgi:cytochrome c-type biogenesis protein CcmH